MLLMRSKLFVPASRPELFAKAAASAADALSFDLEDSVPLARKAEARDSLAVHLGGADAACGGKVVVVRVNAVGTAFFADDLAAVAGPAVHLVNLPAVDEPDAIREAAAVLDRIPGADGVRLLVNVETPAGLRRAAELARQPRVAGLQTGYADLFEPFGIDRRDEAALAHVRLQVRFAAAEAGVAAYDGAFAGVNDPDAFRAECEAARRHGFAGKSCIHPSQIAAANAAFAPTPTEIARARRIVEAARDAEARGLGAVLVDGAMIDPPFVEGARAVLRLADRLAASDPSTNGAATR